MLAKKPWAHTVYTSESLFYLTHLNVTVMSFLMRASYTASRASFTTYPKEPSTTQLHLESQNCQVQHVLLYIGTGTLSSISTLAFQSTSGYSFSLIHPITLKGMVCDCFRLCVRIVRGSVGRKQTAIPLTIITVLM